MVQAYVITLREGLEAFLIVAISLAFLRRSGRQALATAVYSGIVVSLALSVAAAYVLINASNQEWLDGPLALVAAISVTWLIIHMWRAGRHMKGDIEGRLGGSALKTGASAFLGVFLFTVLMVTREGMETALLLLQLKDTLNLATGAMLGVLSAAGVAALWTRYGKRVNLGLFFQVTAIFLFVFVIQLTIAGIHEMSEQGYLPFSAPIHDATEPWGPDGPFGHMLTYMLVLLPAAWLVFAGVFGPRRPRMEQHPAR
jgi:high-affinity iron transporter